MRSAGASRFSDALHLEVPRHRYSAPALLEQHSSGEKAEIGKRSGDCREENGWWIEELLEEEEVAR